MKRPITAIAATALATMTVAAVAGVSAAQADTAHVTPSVSTLPGSAPAFATASRAMGAVASSQQLTIQVWLRPRTAAAESYATAVAAPGSPLYQRYLSPGAYTARFGASRTAAKGVEKWLTSAGFTGVAADAGRDYVQATAPVSTINAALNVQLKYYRATSQVNAGAYALRANDRSVSVPSSVAGSVLGVTGLSNAAPKTMWTRPGSTAGTSQTPAAGKPISFPCSSYYAQHYARRLPKVFGTINIPTIICGYSANQIRRAYGYSSRNVGKGVTVALVELGLTPDMFLTLQDYTAANRIQAPSASRYAELSLGRGSACGDFFNIEEQLDVEASYDMAPLANQLVVGGDSCNNGFFGLQGLFDADTAILNGVGGHPLAQIASNSWGGFGESQPASITNIEHAYLVRSAIEGVSMLFSSGDGGGVGTPANDPFATAVGGTTLGIGNKAARLFETGWSTGVSFDVKNRWINEGLLGGAAGGGPSLLWAQPAYQRGVVPSWLAKAPGNRGGLVRAVPDISAVADPTTGFNVGLLTFNKQGNPTGFIQFPIGGTSLASPLVAGLVADAEQGQHHSFGFLNPALYRMARTNAVHDVLPVTSKAPARYHGVACDVAMCGVLSLVTFDVESYSTLGYDGQVTRTGYDTMTGVGTPAGQNFVSALRKLR
jgi:subtilase family serine protease